MTVLKQLLVSSFSPLGILSILLACGLLATMARRGSRAGHRLLYCGAGFYIIFLFTPLAEVLIARLEQTYPPLLHPDPSSGIRTIVVLAAYGEDQPSLPATGKLTSESAQRMVEGIRLYQDLPGAKMIFSGGILRKGDRPLARMMADFAIAMGIAEKDLIVEGKSLTTYENLLEVQKILGAAPFFLVTSSCHLRRAMGTAKKLGMTPVAAPAAPWASQRDPRGLSWSARMRAMFLHFVSPSSERLYYLQIAYHEYVGYWWYWMLGRI